MMLKIIFKMMYVGVLNNVEDDVLMRYVENGIENNVC